MKAPMVSVIINCYNSERFLREAIDSVIAQTFQDWELIFWDNQSTDGSVEIVKSYDDSRITYYYAPEHTNLGQGRINALEKANCEWVSYLDADDHWFPTKLEKQISLTGEDKDIGLIYSNVFIDYYSDENNLLKRKEYNVPRHFTEEPTKYLLRINFISWPSVMFNRGKLDLAGGLQDYAFSVDYDLSLKLASNSNLVHIPDFLSVYRIHGDNMSLDKKEVGYLDGLDIVMKYKASPDFPVGAACHVIRLMILYLKTGELSKFRMHFKKLLSYRIIAIEAIAFFMCHKLKKIFKRDM